MTDLEQYLKEWSEFRFKCETKVKGICTINSDGWKKLREFHLELFLKKLKAPLYFLMTMKYRNRKAFEYFGMEKFYRKLLRERAERVDSPLPNVLNYLNRGRDANR